MKRKDSLARRLSPLLLTAALFALWEVVVRGFRIPEFILPAPSSAIASAWTYRDAIAMHAWQTLMTTFIGFMIAVGFGLVLGMVLGSSRTVYRASYPLLIGFNSIPKAALVPILVIWFGIGTVPAILSAFLISFFPIVVNVATGLATVEPEIEDVLRSLGARRLDILIKVGIPRSLPYFFASLKVAITLAFVGSVISETVASNQGIGFMMMAASSRFNVPLAFAGLLVVAVMGIIMYEVAAAVERRCTRWAHRGNSAAM
jgi:NitT/TauT family transport system permease protein